jgi:hypothetical protein
MPSLKEQVSSPEKRNAVVDDAVRVLDEEVADKSGLSGMAIKGAYKVVQGVKPGFVRHMVDDLLDDFLGALDPIYQEAAEKKVAAGSYLLNNSGRVADSLLSITDGRAERAKQAMLKSAYEKLRPMAKKQVEGAMPRLSRMIERHAAPTV